MFVRGFNLDHGTDFQTRLEGMPVNLPTHAHGQGYTDLNFIIPELVEVIDYKLGVYYAEQGDFGSAGGAEFHLLKRMERPLAGGHHGLLGLHARGGRRLRARRVGEPARRRRGEGLRRPVGARAGTAAVQRARALHLGPRAVAVLPARHGLLQPLGRVGPDPDPRRRRGNHLPLRAGRLHPGWGGPALQPLGHVAARGRRVAAGCAGVRHPFDVRSLLELHLPAQRSHARRPVQPAREPHHRGPECAARTGTAGLRPLEPVDARPAEPRRLHRRRGTLPDRRPGPRRHGAARRRHPVEHGTPRRAADGLVVAVPLDAWRARGRVPLRRRQRPAGEFGAAHRRHREPEAVARLDAVPRGGALRRRRVRLPQQRRARARPSWWIPPPGIRRSPWTRWCVRAAWSSARARRP